MVGERIEALKAEGLEGSNDRAKDHYPQEIRPKNGFPFCIF